MGGVSDFNKTMAKLELENPNKTFTPQVIPVKEISLSVDDGEFLTLLGSSGCGKSIILRLIAELEQPTRGPVYIGGRDVTQWGAGDRCVAQLTTLLHRIEGAIVSAFNVYCNR
jgi:multiple sugar transport system ATP-binding protein